MFRTRHRTVGPGDTVYIIIAITISYYKYRRFRRSVMDGGVINCRCRFFETGGEENRRSRGERNLPSSPWNLSRRTRYAQFPRTPFFASDGYPQFYPTAPRTTLHLTPLKRTLRQRSHRRSLLRRPALPYTSLFR